MGVHTFFGQAGARDVRVLADGAEMIVDAAVRMVLKYPPEIVRRPVRLEAIVRVAAAPTGVLLVEEPRAPIGVPGAVPERRAAPPGQAVHPEGDDVGALERPADRVS